MVELVAAAAGYLVGSIPFALLIGKLRRRDLRQLGTGNVGASNAYRQIGKLWGALVFALDIGKSLVPMLILAQVFDSPLAATTWALAAFVGHCWPIWLRFTTAGRGVAVLTGMYLAFGVLEGTPIFLLGMVAGYGAGLVVRRPGFAVVAMKIGSAAVLVPIEAQLATVIGTLAGLLLFLFRRAWQLPGALAKGGDKRLIIWLVMAEDIDPHNAQIS